MKLPLLLLTVGLGSLCCCSGGGATGGGASSDYRAEGPEVRISLKAEPVGLNPILSVQSVARYVSEQIFQTLNEQDPQTFELVPVLASTPVIEQSDRGSTIYRYTLDSLARWPNGSPVTVSDVVFSFKVLMNPLVEAGPYRPYYEMVYDVVADSLDPQRTFRVITKRPYILAAEAIGDMYVYPEYAYDPQGLLTGIPLSQLTDPARADSLVGGDERLRQFADFFNDPELSYAPDRIVGSGPYELLEWRAGQYLRLRRRDDYWARELDSYRLAATPAYLNFLIIPDPITTVNALRDQAIDVVVDMPVDEFQQLRNDDYLSQHYDFVAVPGFRYFSILFNQDDPLLSDSLTRRALAYTVDVDQIIDRLLPGLARRIVGPVLPTKPYYNDQLSGIPYDLREASRLLQRAGWRDTNGNGIVDKLIDGERRELSFQLLSYPTPTSEAVTLVVAEGGRRIGVDIEVVKREPRTLLATLDAGNFTASFYGLGFEPTPDDFAQLWSSTSVPPAGTNRGNFQNAEADRLITKIATTTTASERAALYRRFQEIVYANQPMIFLYSPYDRVVISKRFEYKVSSLAPNVRLNALSLRDPARLSR